MLRRFTKFVLMRQHGWTRSELVGLLQRSRADRMRSGTRTHVHTHVCPCTRMQMHTRTRTGTPVTGVGHTVREAGESHEPGASCRPGEAGGTIRPESSPQGPGDPMFKSRSEPEAQGPGARCPGVGMDDGLRQRARARTNRTAGGRAGDAPASGGALAVTAAVTSHALRPGRVAADHPSPTASPVFQ